MLVDGGRHAGPAPKVCFNRPTGPSIGVKRQRNLHPATSRATHAGPLLHAAVHDQPQLARRHRTLAWMLSDTGDEQVVAQPPKPTQRSRD